MLELPEQALEQDSPLRVLGSRTWSRALEGRHPLLDPVRTPSGLHLGLRADAGHQAAAWYCEIERRVDHRADRRFARALPAKNVGDLGEPAARVDVHPDLPSV